MTISTNTRLLLCCSALLLAACNPDKPAADGSVAESTADPAPQVSASGFEPSATAAAAETGAASTGSRVVVTLRGLTDGDRACYLQVDGDGGARELMADMALCERTDLVGQEVRLSIGHREVAAESCQGDPECAEQETVELVHAIEAVDANAAAAD